MDRSQPYWTDERMDHIVGNLLRAGVMLAAAVVLCGAVLYLIQEGAKPADHRKFQGEPPELRSLAGIVGDALTLDGKGVIQFGLLLLLATPVARVLLSAAVFALQRDRLYVVITLLVLALLVVSLVGVNF